MDFTLTDDQRLLVESVSSLLDRACPPSVVRAVAEGDRDEARLPALRDFVAVGDGPATDHVLVAERLGRVCAPGTWFVSSALALPLLRAAGHDAADAVAAGERSATVAWAGADGRWDLLPVDRTRTFVLDVDLCDDVVLVDGADVRLDPPIRSRQIGWLDLTRTAWELEFSPATTAAPGLGIDLRSILERATVVLAAELCGTARRMLDLAVDYAKAAGAVRPAHRELPGGAAPPRRSRPRRGASVGRRAMGRHVPRRARRRGDRRRTRAPHVAKAAASEAAKHSILTSIQVHGGIGYTWEHDLHLWIRRARTTAHLLGTADEHHDQLAALVVS